MKLDIKKVIICVTIPLNMVEIVRRAGCAAGAGEIGDYTFCSYSVKGKGTFLPNQNANPYIGNGGKLEIVDEERIEFVCEVEKVKQVILALKSVHPYEEPVINIIPILDEADFY